MVNHGRPSTACLACRQRRLKCDRLPMGCSQCRRKAIQCAGYRDPFALRVKDETARISCKFDNKTVVSKSLLPLPASASSSVAKLSAAEMDTSNQAPPAPAPSPYRRVNELCGSFDLGIMPPPPRDNSAYLPAIFLDSPSTGDACSIAIEATALAAYSRRVRSCGHLKESRKKAETAVVDRTLACVLVLGLFEAIVFEGGTSPTSWTAHTNGSMQLLLLRGPQQFTSRLSRTISSHASNNIKTSCIQRCIPVPDDFIVLDKKLLSLQNAGEPSAMVSPIMHQIASLKARHLADSDCNFVHDALLLDRQILFLAETAPDWMIYEIRPNSESPCWAYKRVCHRYTSVPAARIWNILRLFHLFLVNFVNEVISPEDRDAEWDLSELRIPDPSKSLSQYVLELRDYATRTMDVITTDLLATIPVFMEGGQNERRFAPAARSLAWPLAIIELSDLSSKAAQDFASRQLDRLAGDLNMPTVVHPSRLQEAFDDWLHLFYVV
ncbi:hypothetical protein E4U43_003545 [Claviceps pusilla]|uniref:Zn(2)-C6 fungal-type domain-containing protein n=1 Tax=Claviceps pusilla TaxID=123648 RepID=A0A9P7NFF6_9HYPO|nr:hypothetical protein E4U43_003545 [Claviceps pusilla]